MARTGSKAKTLSFKVRAAEKCFEQLMRYYPAKNLAEFSAAASFAENCIKSLLPIIELDPHLSNALRLALGSPVREYFETCTSLVMEQIDINVNEKLTRQIECALRVVLSIMALANPESEGEEMDMR